VAVRIGNEGIIKGMRGVIIRIIIGLKGKDAHNANHGIWIGRSETNEAEEARGTLEILIGTIETDVLFAILEIPTGIIVVLATVD